MAGRVAAGFVVAGFSREVIAGFGFAAKLTASREPVKQRRRMAGGAALGLLFVAARDTFCRKGDPP